MTRFLLSLVVLVFVSVAPASAQQQVFVQVEAHPSLNAGEAAVRRYASRVQDVNGFTLRGGWYAVALGPYSPGDAQAILRNLRAARLIPRDSYIARVTDYRQQFWPVGTNLLGNPALLVPQNRGTENVQTDSTPDTTEEAAVPEPQLPEPSDETVRQARNSEAQLSREERAELQIALEWAGFYSGAIDAAFGRGTRNSMALWQEANNFEVTGVLTTRQRAVLLQQYNSVLEDLDLALVRDAKAGIEIQMPTAMVAFEKYEPPFAHYTGDGAAQVLLISQEGNRATLTGLYDIMQTLAIVPETGERVLNSNSFKLIGEGSKIVSHTEVTLDQGRLKGFSLIWPAGDEERRTRLLAEMQKSFVALDAVLDPASGSGTQSIDLISGLEIRKPRLSRSGFYVDRVGTVVTTSEVVAECRRITIDERFEAEIAVQDAERGIAVLRPLETLAPIGIAAFSQDEPRLKSDVAVAGYSYGGVLGAPTVTFGQLADVQGLNGEQDLKRLALTALDGDAGGPVVDAGGAVLGMLLPEGQGGRQLPDGVSFAAKADVIRGLLDQLGVSTLESRDRADVGLEALTNRASGMTVLVSCWD
ncbi:serine protease [Roseovarius phycicola]|uniref:Serine protease n=1 Tax=Roseovarius phycicola TaxID=3080976 RepID=A0ABZ2HKY3_9RHOB